jgi:hypothetical protein
MNAPSCLAGPIRSFPVEPDPEAPGHLRSVGLKCACETTLRAVTRVRPGDKTQHGREGPDPRAEFIVVDPDGRAVERLFVRRR